VSPFASASPTHEVLGAYVAHQVARVLDTEPLVRRDVRGSVHAMRVATRSLRSVLDAYRRVFADDGLGDTRDELRWLAGELGSLRDAEVLAHRVLEQGRQAQGEAWAAALREVTDELSTQRRSAHRDLVLALESERYRELLAGLEGLAGQRPSTKDARRPVDEVAGQVLPAAFRTVQGRMLSAAAAVDSRARDVELHGARKAAKTARYAAEAVQPALGTPAERYAVAMASIQKLLGRRQDAVVMEQALASLVSARPRPDLARLCGHLRADQQLEVASVDARLDASWRRAATRAIASGLT
jgi:CHAD domain-containing protein